MVKRCHRARGFSVAELVLALVLSAVVLAAVLSALVALVRGMQPQEVTVAGEPLPIAPTFGAFPAAVRLHQVFAARAGTARAVYVFGGRQLTVPDGITAADLRPLRLMALPRIERFSSGLPMDAKGFYEAYSAALGAGDASRSLDDFSLVVIGPHAGRLAVTAFAQVWRRDVALNDGTTAEPLVVRETMLWDIEDGAQRYAFVERPDRSSGVFVGAVHTWARFAAGTVAEEGPACVVFPDPWVYGGLRDEPGSVPPYSRFSYFLAVSP